MVSYVTYHTRATKIRGLNPYCSGQWSRTVENFPKRKEDKEVLILIVVDIGLVQEKYYERIGLY